MLLLRTGRQGYAGRVVQGQVMIDRYSIQPQTDIQSSSVVRVVQIVGRRVKYIISLDGDSKSRFNSQAGTNPRMLEEIEGRGQVSNIIRGYGIKGWNSRQGYLYMVREGQKRGRGTGREDLVEREGVKIVIEWLIEDRQRIDRRVYSGYSSGC